uniref:ATP synthase mitochondrial F1 complex assembly factor 1 n=1 Tax=Amphilophus citrinellus TaxID=61819 RepID=A0A3Q0SFB0_AMPCI
MAAAMVQMSCLYRGMLAVRATGIRTLIPGLVPVQFRAFSVRKEPELEENPYYSKYQEKIQKLRSAKPQEYEARMEKRHEAKKEMLGHSKQAEFVRFMEQELEKRDKMAAGDGTSGGFTKNKTLGSILNLEMIRDKTGEEIAELWMKYYSTKDTISAVIPFLYALPQKEGYEFFVGQWSQHELHFTSLINVQTVFHQLAEFDSFSLNVHQAQCLANQVQLFYGTQRQETYRLVELFNHHPAEFKHMSVIAELEQSGLGPAAPPRSS